MPETRMVLMTESEKKSFDSTADLLREVSQFDTDTRNDYYYLANVFQEIVDRIWDYGFVLRPEELVYTDEEREERNV